MKMIGQTFDSPFYGVTRSILPSKQSRLDGIACNGDVHTKTAFIDSNCWFDKKNPGRPYMHISGECLAIRGALPNNINEIVFEEGSGIPVDFLYEFSDDELANLTKKGLYRHGFKCPDEIYSNVLDMPIDCNFTIIEPESDKDFPIIFVDIANKHHIVTDSEHCGYVFADYFKEVPYKHDLDDTIDFYDMELEHDLLESQAPIDDIEVTYEKVKSEKTEFDEIIDKHYEKINERVEDKHIKSYKKHLTDNSIQDTMDSDISEETDVINTAVNRAINKILPVAENRLTEHDLIMDEILEVDELSETPLIDINEDIEYRRKLINELFMQDPDVVIAQMESVYKIEPAVLDALNMAKAQRNRIREAELLNKHEDRFERHIEKYVDEAFLNDVDSDLENQSITHVVPQHIQDIADDSDILKSISEENDEYVDLDV